MSNRRFGQAPNTLPHGIDIEAPGGIEALLDFHRRTFGDAVMEAGAGAGGAGDSGGTGDGSGGTSGGTGTEGGAGGPAEGSEGSEGGKNDSEEGKVEDLPKWAQDLISQIRNEAATNRVKGKQAADAAAEQAKQSVIQEIGKALGLVKDDDDKSVDAAKVQSELVESQRELAIYRMAPQDVKVQALLDSRSFMASIKDIDPGDSAALKAAIDEAVSKNPAFKATQVVTKSGGDLGGGSGEQQKSKPTTLQGALDAYYAG